VPEGDTLWRTARRLHAALVGEPLVLAELRWPGVADLDLVGARTAEVLSRGKHLLHRLDSGMTVHSHLRMEGQWRVARAGVDTASFLRRADLRAALGTADWTAVGLRLGVLDVVPTNQEADLVGHLGPDVLGPDWDPARAATAVSAHPATVGEALLDQRTLAGVGTFWASEALFLEGILPWTPAAQLSAGRVAALVGRVQRLMDAGRRYPVMSSTGIHRRGQESYVHARSGRPCRRCGNPVRVAAIGYPPTQRVLFSCPTCQGGLAPTDDGHPQRPLGSR
jgi:endonuclease-8